MLWCNGTGSCISLPTSEPIYRISSRNESGLVVPSDYHLSGCGCLHTGLFGCLCQPRIEPWAGIEMDVETTLRFGLHRPSVTGPIFVYRVCTALRQDTPPGCRSCHMQIYLLTSYLVPLQASIQTCVILGLMEGGSCVPSTPPEDIQGIGVNASLLHSYSSR